MSARKPGLRRPRSKSLSELAGSEDIFRTASSRLMTCSSRTYLARMRAKVPKARGAELWPRLAAELAGLMGAASQSMETNEARSTACFWPSFMLLRLTKGSPCLMRSKKTSQGSTLRRLAAACTERPFNDASPLGPTEEIKTLSQLLPTQRYQFSQSEVVSISRRISRRKEGAASDLRKASEPAAKWRG